jgi:hypothetical protein
MAQVAREAILFWLEAVMGNDPAQNIIDHEANTFYRVEIGGRRMLQVGLNTATKALYLSDEIRHIMT